MRLLTLCPSLTETVFDLGCGADLIGRTKFCVHPADRVAELPVVGGTKDPRLDSILDLSPDLVLMNREENRSEDAEALRAAGVEVADWMPRDPAETAVMVREMGGRIGAAGAAERIAQEIEAAAAEAASAAPARAPSFVYLIWRGPYMAVGQDTFISRMLEVAGARNALGGEERYPTLEPEQLARLDPELVLLSSEPFPFGDKHVPEFTGATGLPAERCRLVDGELLSWHGSRTPAGLRYASGLVGP